MKRLDLRVAGPALVSQLDPDPPAVLAAHAAADEPVPLQPRDQTRQRALAEMDAGSELLYAIGGAAVLGRPFREDVEHLEIAGSQAVPVEYAVELAQCPGVQREKVAPLVDECPIGPVRCHIRTLAEPGSSAAHALNARACNLRVPFEAAGARCRCDSLLSATAPVTLRTWGDVRRRNGTR